MFLPSICFRTRPMHHAGFRTNGSSQLTIYARIPGGRLSRAHGMALHSFGGSTGRRLCPLFCRFRETPRSPSSALLEIWLFATVGFAVRPQMIGYLLLIVELLLHSSREDTGCAMVLGLATPVCVMGELPRLLLRRGSDRGDRRMPCRLLDCRQERWISARWDPKFAEDISTWSLALSVAALFLNPVGKSQILYPLETMLHQSIGLSQVQEWQPLQVTNLARSHFSCCFSAYFSWCSSGVQN